MNRPVPNLHHLPHPRRLRRQIIARAVRAFSAVAVFGAMLALGNGCTPKGTDSGSAAPLTSSAPLTQPQRDANLASFDLVWKLVRDRHYDSKLNGVDWVAVRDELRPKVESATSTDQVRALIGDMISRLGQSHMAVLPSEAYAADELAAEQASAAPAAGNATSSSDAPASKSAAPTAPSQEQGSVGIDVRVFNNRAFVTDVTPGSPAALAGVKPGWEVVSVGRYSIRRNLARQSAASTPSVGMPATALQALRLRALVGGSVGETRHIGFLNDNDKAEIRSLVAVAPSGMPFKFGQLPTEYVDLRSELLPGNIGYISTNIWLDPARTMRFVAASVTEFSGARGMIIDLRGNPGGLGAMASGMGGFFVTQPDQVLGEMKMRSGNQRFLLTPRKPSFNGPVAILIDELSASTSEIFAGGMRDIGRARVFGARSAGAALPSVIELLPNGDRFQYVFANYTSASGKVLEGNGVEPDEVVAFDRRALLAGKDPVVDKARNWILAQSPTVTRLP